MFSYTSKESMLFREQKLAFALSNRLGGASVGRFSGLNLAYHVGDNPKNVAHNHQIITSGFYDYFDIAESYRNPMYYCEQTHSVQSLLLDKVLELELDTRNDSICIGSADAIVTHLSYKICLIMVADCNPILFYDKKNHAMALIHAGRKGVLGGIIFEVFERMQTLYKTRAKDYLVYVGASIRSCCYEVGLEIRDELAGLGLDEHINKDNKLDLIGCLQTQFKSLNIPLEQIEISPSCSCCEESLYSYRREKTSGRFGLLAMLL